MNTIAFITPVQMAWVILIVIILAVRVSGQGFGLLIPLLAWLLRRLFLLLLLVGLIAVILYLSGNGYRPEQQHDNKHHFKIIKAKLYGNELF